MATFRKRNGNWNVQMYVHGKQISKTFTNKDHAKAWIAEQNRLIRHTPERVFAHVPLVELTG